MRKARTIELHRVNREKEKAQTAAWMAVNRDACLARRREKRRQNRDAVLDHEAEYRRTHADSIKKSIAKWRRSDRGKLVQMLCTNRRRANLAKAGEITVEELESIRKSARGRCYYCREKRKLTYDHVQPVSKDGPNAKWNFVMACHSCNSRKKDTPPEIYARKIGLLLI